MTLHVLPTPETNQTFFASDFVSQSMLGESFNVHELIIEAFV